MNCSFGEDSERVYNVYWALVFQKVDSAIHWIAQLVPLILIHWIAIYPVEYDIHLLNGPKNVHLRSQNNDFNSALNNLA